MLRHALATLAYRTVKALRDAPARFPEFDPGKGVRGPHRLIAHMASDLEFARATLTGEPYEGQKPSTWHADLDHFWEELARLDALLASTPPLAGDAATRLLQGPIADAITHAGQLAMLRRLAGSPVPGENFRVADIEIGRVGPQQARPVKPFEPRG